ncbi:hypothetical protein NtRootA9_02140 [Arthrobacter sp. NtRootA9]|nr:hypothetical protein NtRootA9_02140 [Arthrobacter sp. NtRootA9]
MKRGWALLLAVVVAVLAVIAVIGGLSRTPHACPAIGYAYTGPVELMFSTPPASVAACFGEGCTPEPVAQNDERKWLVPQSAPYLNELISVTTISVEATAAIGGRTAAELPVETESTGENPFGVGCGGPFRFKPVQVTFN